MQEYLEKLKGIQSNLLSFIENEGNVEENYQNLINKFNDFNIQNSHEKVELILRLICKITKNHYRHQNFYDKISQILHFIIENTRNIISNQEILDIFIRDRRVILLLIEEKLILVDEAIALKIFKYPYSDYSRYLFPEIEPYIDEESKKKISDELFKNKDTNYLKIFKEKRRIGENDNYICELIRKDLIDEYINYKKNRYESGPEIKKSIFETNDYLCSHDIEPLDYAAFFGSVKIFEYLYKRNKLSLKKGIWNCAMHCPNENIIQILEENHDRPPPNDFNSCIKNADPYYTFEIVLQEAVKCHHNEVANYILAKHINKNDEEWRIANHYKKNIYAFAFKYCNYQFFPEDLNYKYYFFYSCQYDYIKFVEFLLKDKSIDINESIILKKTIFLK